MKLLLITIFTYYNYYLLQFFWQQPLEKRLLRRFLDINNFKFYIFFFQIDQKIAAENFKLILRMFLEIFKN